MSSFPLQVRIGIRDHWARKDSPFQKALRDLQALVRPAVVIDPEWPLLVTELEAFYPDKTNLVAVVAGCVQAWMRSMVDLLENAAAHQVWRETALGKMHERMQAFVEVSGSDKGGTSWSEQREGFVISLPRAQVVQPAELFHVFREELLACFGVRDKVLPERTAAAGVEDWEGVEVDTARGRAEVIEIGKGLQGSSRPKVEFFPDVASLPRPDQLFLQPPYHLTLFQSHQHLELHCSHSPTLKLLAEYLKRWCRVNHADTRNPPTVQITLHQSAFGLGEMFDRLTLSTEDTRYTNQFTVTAPMVVSLIERVLGYELISTHGSWHFRRDEAFNAL